VLIELSGAENDAHYIDRLMELAQGDGVIAQSESQAQELWAMREGLSAAQKSEGPSIKHDVSVPVSKLPEFVEKTLAAIAQKFPEARPCPFGHAGDGNLHFNISVPEGFADKQAVSDLIHQAVLSYQGSIAAEHGVGLMKRDLLKASKSPLEMQMMVGLKGLFDPDHILNPGKVI
jgi:FAD/FMN-containing dehydrogenase